ncbi:6-phosphofructokinase [Thermosipho melanesiensis]|uniref:6-phosphofructokinase n=2 Tax=Thermosipho melanesiensis TaxID=46541 RepID=A6LP83_THEM4|nr:6-phosphofructokinase [Thermosipho melanesiensis]ABR31734.1 6-phosphofructokinase [Thermosipho melanesiensis BI429]APT74756.1 6-phosphofructokinase [Thermosipho melanesiensis]OOC35076.1 6-phosphofructokinase [Thermosipho melanesiensis]OOC35112.1 6-phosphofructokinase [Thermosipho melanesiensis]OOC36720.1 6-phosphofructokinase [Thermosipho melanesiensis]
MKRIGVLCVGNDSPGINSAIRAAVVKGLDLDIEVMGIRDGFEGFLKDNLDVLLRPNVSNILHQGGTMLGTSLFVPEGEELNRVKEKVEQYGISTLLIIGGRLAARSAINLMKIGIPSIIIPATIDNDLSFTDFSIGFFTAIENVKNALDVLHSTAESHHRVMLVETMGKPSGWIAVIGGLAGGADYIISSAEKPNFDELIEIIRKRYEGKKRFSLVVVESGVEIPEEIKKECKVSEKESSAIIVGRYIEKHLKELGIEWRYTNLGYLQRGGSPSAMDRIIATQMASHAVEMVKMGKVYHAVGVKGFSITEIPYSDTIVNYRPVDYYLKELTKLFY